MANFRSYLPPSVQQQIIDLLTLDMQDNRQHIVAVAQETLQRHEREEEQATVQLLVNRAGHGDLAVLGQQETLAAVNTARVHQLVLARDSHRDGGRCRTCGALTAETPRQCPMCGGTLTTVELGEAMVQAVLRHSGWDVSLLPALPLESIAALLLDGVDRGASWWHLCFYVEEGSRLLASIRQGQACTALPFHQSPTPEGETTMGAEESHEPQPGPTVSATLSFSTPRTSPARWSSRVRRP